MDSEKIELPLELIKADQIPEGQATVITIPGGIQIALFKLHGRIYALDNACPHMGGPLGEGEIEGDVVTCPWHGWQFDIKNGTNINDLGDNATSLKISVRDGSVYLDELPLNF